MRPIYHPVTEQAALSGLPVFVTESVLARGGEKVTFAWVLPDGFPETEIHAVFMAAGPEEDKRG